MNNSGFAHLHIHNEYSLLDGTGTAEQYAKKAREMNFKHLAITNHGNVDGCIRWQQECRKQKIHSILGCEFYIAPDMSIREKGEKKHHIVLLAKNLKGWRNILKLCTYANMQGFYYKPRIDPDILLDHLDGVFVLTACLRSFISADYGINLLCDLIERTDVAIEVMPHDLAGQPEFNELCIRLSKMYNVPLIATNDCHYIRKDQAKIQEVLLAMQTKKKWSDPKRWKFDINSLYLMSVDEMIQAFTKQGIVKGKTLTKALENTLLVANKCKFFMNKVEVGLPRPPSPVNDIMDDDEQLINLTFDGYKERKKKHSWITDKAYSDRINDELTTIISLGFARYFLVVYELISWCKENNIMTGPGRGSVGGSLVAYCLGITEVDPIKYNLVFSRFISEARIDMPDIDMDFEDRKRKQIRKHLEDIYGKHNVTGLSTFSKMHGRGVLRDVSRVFDIPLVEVSKAAKTIVVRSGGDVRADFSLQDAFDTFEDGKRFKNKYPEVSKIAIELEGQIKNCGQHASATCVSKRDLRSGENTAYAMRSKILIANWDKEDAEYMGLMKLDILGLNALTILAETKKKIKETQNVVIDYETLPLDDPKIYEEFNKGNNIGVFQFGGPSIMRLGREIGIKDFEDLVALNALHRPGCLRSGMTVTYRKRKHGLEKIKYIHPYMENITGSTQGLILYQEQIMQLMYQIGGLQWKTADMIRKVVSKSKGEEQFMKFKKMFIDGCKKRKTVPQREAEKIFEELKYFGSYGFNRAHAVEYSMIAAWEMWLKVYYPAEYMITLLTFGSDQKKEVYVQETKRLGLKILLPDINKSLSSEWILDEGDNMMIPLTEIKGIGEVASNVIEKERIKNGLYRNKEDLLKRTPKQKVNSKIIGLLEKVDAFCALEDKQELSEEKLEKLSELFNFSLSNDPMYRYRKLIKKLRLNIKPIEKIIFDQKRSIEKIMGKSNYHFGKMVALKFGYRGKFKDLSKETAGTADDLGGVYGDFGDESNVVMLVFGSDLYREKKYEIEHCEDQWMLTKAKVTNTNCLHTNKVWFGDDLIKGEAEGLRVELIKTIPFIKKQRLKDLSKEITGCKSCDLRKQCRKPVLFSIGELNIMIIGEAPGYNEDKQGKGFVGDSGDLLWGDLKGYGLERNQFHVTNTCKCYPKDIKTPQGKHLRRCSQWLEKEIEIVKPFVMLSFGNTGLKYFKDQSSGIMDLSGDTEWSDKYNCWICYCLHPAAVLYHRENMSTYLRGIKNFINKIGYLGFGL